MLLDGVDLRELRCASLRRQIAMVLQPPLVFPTTLRENIAYGRPDATEDEIVARRAMAPARRLHRARCREGYDTIVGEQGATLSEGEQQRMTIARAILRDAPILILDEPTSALDVETEALIMAALERLHARAARRSSSRTASRRCGTPTRSSCCATAGSPSRARSTSWWRAAGRSRRLYGAPEPRRQADPVGPALVSGCVVLHLAGQYPLAGIALAGGALPPGLTRLGHDVYYVEDSGAPPYDPRVRAWRQDSSYNVAFLADVDGAASASPTAGPTGTA